MQELLEPPTHTLDGYEVLSEIDRLQAFPELQSHRSDNRNNNIRKFIFPSDMSLDFVGSGRDATEVQK